MTIVHGRAVYELGHHVPDEDNGEDNIAELQEIVGAYARCTSHDERPDPAHERVVAFYLCTPYNPNVTRIVHFTTEWSGYDLDCEDDIQRTDPYPAPTDAVIIRLKIGTRCEYTAGYYFPGSGGFLFSDFAHTSENVHVFAQVWPMIVTEFGLRAPVAPVTKKAKKAKRLMPHITLGADPEYEAVNAEGAVIDARQVLYRGSSDTENEVGTDGAGSQIELRPSPGSPAHVVKETKRLMKAFCKKFPGYALTSAGEVYPCGGHIHIGGIADFGHTSDLVRLLDDFIGKPSLLQNGSARLDGGYGHLGDIESKEWGFEYRTPPASIFSDPKVTKAALAITLGLVRAYYARDVIAYADQPTAGDYVKVARVSEKTAKTWYDWCHGASAEEEIQRAWHVRVCRAKHSRVTFLGNIGRDLQDAISRLEPSLRVNLTVYVISPIVCSARYGATIPIVGGVVVAPIIASTQRNVYVGLALEYADAYGTNLRRVMDGIRSVTCVS